jgi:hypothetical protein
LGFSVGESFYAYALNNPVLRIDPLGLESGDLNKLVPGPDGETAKNIPCPDCLAKMYRELEKELSDVQRTLGKPGCVATCSIWGFGDDAAIRRAKPTLEDDSRPPRYCDRQGGG